MLGVLAAAVLAAAGIGVSLGALLAPTHQPTSAAPGSADAARQSPIVAAGGSLCGLRGLEPAGATLTLAPAATWSTVGLMSAPSSPTVGPGRRQPDGLRWCYAHTAEGAVFAAANFVAAASDPRLTYERIRQNVAAGPGRDVALTKQYSPANNGLTAQIDAFRVTNYTPTTATVDVVALLSDGRQVSAPTPLIWQDGDWKVQVTDSGEAVFPIAILTSLDGYTPWAGTS